MTQKQRLLLSLAGVVVAAAGMFAWAFFGVFQTEKAEEARKDAEARLFALDPDDVVRLEVTSGKGDTVLVRGDDGWSITSPVEAKADRAAVDNLLATLSSSRRKKVVDEKATDLASFGLAPPKAEVVAKTADGREARLAVGDENTFDRSRFVTTGDEVVGTAEASLERALDKSTFDLRDKRIVVFGDDTLEAVSSAGAATWELRRKDGQWHVGEEIADERETGRILRALHDLRATAFPAGEAAAFGLAEPLQTVELRRKELPTLTLRFGIAEGKTYVRLDEGPIAEVDDKILGDLRKTPSDLRDRRVIPFDESKVSALEFQAGDETFRAERGTGEGGARTWSLVAPRSAAAKQWKLSSALSTLKELRFDEDAQEPGEDAGLDAPARTVTVLGEGGAKLATLLVGADVDGKTWVKSAETGRAGTVDTSRIRSLPKDFADAEEEAPAPEAAAD
ncbi:MAG TPA: DUF4340 domain-containing protein [Vulgatibacter sp.]|nr:DUF4340 domain-containing protein [Vulgatibacter sp.]